MFKYGKNAKVKGHCDNGPCKTIGEFGEYIQGLIELNKTAGVAVVLVHPNGEYTSHQFGLEIGDMRIAAELFKRYASHTEKTAKMN